jgi:hypothetical protein
VDGSVLPSWFTSGYVCVGGSNGYVLEIPVQIIAACDSWTNWKPADVLFMAGTSPFAGPKLVWAFGQTVVKTSKKNMSFGLRPTRTVMAWSNRRSVLSLTCFQISVCFSNQPIRAVLRHAVSWHEHCPCGKHKKVQQVVSSYIKRYYCNRDTSVHYIPVLYLIKHWTKLHSLLKKNVMLVDIDLNFEVKIFLVVVWEDTGAHGDKLFRLSGRH